MYYQYQNSDALVNFEIKHPWEAIQLPVNKMSSLKKKDFEKLYKGKPREKSLFSETERGSPIE